MYLRELSQGIALPPNSYGKHAIRISEHVLSMINNERNSNMNNEQWLQLFASMCICYILQLLWKNTYEKSLVYLFFHNCYSCDETKLVHSLLHSL